MEIAQPNSNPSNVQHAADNRPWYQKGALPLGSCIGGIHIYLHWSFFALLLMVVASTLLTDSLRSDGAYWGVMLLLYGPILLVTIIIHEFGHAITTNALGGQVGDMVLWPLGGFIICGPVETVAGDFKVAIAGPLMHIPQMLVWGGIYAALEAGDFSNFDYGGVATSETSFGAVVCAQAFYLNLFLFVFNLFVPAYPLDGGRCMAAAFIMCGMSVLKAAITTASIGMLIAGALVMWGLLEIVYGWFNGLFTMLVGVWIFQSSYALFQLTRPVEGGVAGDLLKSHPVFGRQCYQNRAR